MKINPSPPITSTVSLHLHTSTSGLVFLTQTSHSRYFLQLQSFFDRTVYSHLLFHRSKLITHFCHSPCAQVVYSLFTNACPRNPLLKVYNNILIHESRITKATPCTPSPFHSCSCQPRWPIVTVQAMAIYSIITLCLAAPVELLCPRRPPMRRMDWATLRSV